MCYRPAKHEHQAGRWGPRLAVRSSASGSWGIRPMLQTGEAARATARTEVAHSMSWHPKGARKGSMSSCSPAPPQPGLTHTGQTGHLFDKQFATTHITACIYSLSDLFCHYHYTFFSQSELYNKLLFCASMLISLQHRFTFISSIIPNVWKAAQVVSLIKMITIQIQNYLLG